PVDEQYKHQPMAIDIVQQDRALPCAENIDDSEEQGGGSSYGALQVRGPERKAHRRQSREDHDQRQIVQWEKQNQKPCGETQRSKRAGNRGIFAETEKRS